MSPRYTGIVVILLSSLVACTPLSNGRRATTAAQSTPNATIALPAAFTATASPTPIPTLAATPSLSAEDHSAAMSPAFTADAGAFPHATRYELELTVDFKPGESQARIEGMARIRYTNPLDKNLSHIVLMLWPNDDQYQAQMSTGAVLIEGNLVVPQVTLDGLALRLALRPSLAPGDSIDLSLPFDLDVGSIHEGAPKRLGITSGVLIVPTFYPLVPRLVDGEWDVTAAPSAGDTTNSDVALYSVRITSPEDLAVVTSGVEISKTSLQDGTHRLEFVTGPMRDFAFAIGAFEVESLSFGEVTLNAWVLPEHIADAEKVLKAARVQMELLTEMMGPYPFIELDLVDAPGAFGGIEYPGLVYIGTMGTSWVVEPTVHEVAHQWFYAQIGNDQIREPWLDEATATFATALYYERASGLGQGTGYLSNLRAVVRAHPDSGQPIGLDVGAYDSEADYVTFVYYKGALFLEALRHELGSRLFERFLATLYEEHRYGYLSAQDFQNTAEAVCACDLQELFDLWVYDGGEGFQP